MISQTQYHCPCSSEPESSSAPTSSGHYHLLASLYFCEECDALRCPDCVTSEVNIYFCPLCQFEVPSASVRAEQHTCARNCFLCPCCGHTCSSSSDEVFSRAATSVEGQQEQQQQPKYWLTCLSCKWSSKQIGIVFDKPTGLALQLAKMESPDTATMEFDRLREHYEPFLRAGISSNAPPQTPGTAHPATASKGLSSLPSRYGSLVNLSSYSRSRHHGHHIPPPTPRDELQPYQPQLPASSSAQSEAENLEFMMGVTSLDQVAPLSKRAHKTRGQTVDQSALRPSRVPLMAKRTKRCPACKHILVKPESKSNSTKYRIKLVATNYIPAIQLFRRPAVAAGSRLSMAGAGGIHAGGGSSSSTPSSMAAASRRPGARGHVSVASQAPSEFILSPPTLDEPMRPGRSYGFELAFINPLYEPIVVDAVALRPGQSLDSVSGLKSSSSAAAAAAAGTETPTGTPSSMPQSAADFAVHLPKRRFPIAAFAEQWEYEDAEPEDLDELNENRRQSSSGGIRRRQNTGLLEKKANRTTILLELNVGKDYVGPIQAYLLVTYIYTADEPDGSSSPRKGGQQDQDAEKSFSFWASLKLGDVQGLPAASKRVSSIMPSSAAAASVSAAAASATAMSGLPPSSSSSPAAGPS